jgi:GH18 family chitinase
MMVNAGTMKEMYDEQVHQVYAYGGDQFVSYDNKRSIIAKVSGFRVPVKGKGGYYSPLS